MKKLLKLKEDFYWHLYKEELNDPKPTKPDIFYIIYYIISP